MSSSSDSEISRRAGTDDDFDETDIDSDDSVSNIDMNFNPYEYNGGTVTGIAGEDFVVIACDTRFSNEETVLLTEHSKLFQLLPMAVLGSTGCWADVLGFMGLVKERIQLYEQKHNKPMTTEALANMMMIAMYAKRFYPYLVLNILAGLDANGKGMLYTYDPVGFFETVPYTAAGVAGQMLMPILDNQVAFENTNIPPEQQPELTIKRAVSITKDAFRTASERDIFTGDWVQILIITKQGIEEDSMELRHD
ncbi:Pros26 [Drosophila busckii]|uniref:Proteasome subunit beta n=1 Tax=Drosophila busckii TaxID=30019 RepID=A0A0M4ENE1_DROBS|nr:proteasome subunit beta type-1-like [Drosophila busckii]ALC49471.1 Pros26 [Drosophila busckii]